MPTPIWRQCRCSIRRSLRTQPSIRRQTRDSDCPYKWKTHPSKRVPLPGYGRSLRPVSDVRHACSMDTRDRQGSHLRAALFRYLLLPRPQRHIAALDQFATNLFEKTLYAFFLNGLERDSITSRSPIVTLGHLVRGAQRLALADVNVQT